MRQGLCSAIQFLTLVPCGTTTHFDARRALPFFPLVGLLIGGLLVMVDRIGLHLWNASTASILTLTVLAAISGALHLDGLADTADGLYGQRPPEKALEIMKDSRIGAMGMVVVLFCVALKWAGLTGTGTHRWLWLLVVPAYSRSSVLFAIYRLPYGRPSGGTGERFFETPLHRNDFWGLIPVVVISLALGLKALLVLGVFGLMLFGMLAFFSPQSRMHHRRYAGSPDRDLRNHPFSRRCHLMTHSMKLQTLKGRYRFRVAAPSFIFPADYTDNVRRLAPFLDEIELLVFESHPRSLPSAQTIAELKILGQGMNIGYNVHLPIDLALDAPVFDVHQQSMDRLLRAMERVVPLDATTQTLHLDYREKDHQPDTVKAWQARMIHSVGRILEAGPLAPEQLSVENLDYPPDYLRPIVSDLGLRTCIDIGHIIRFYADLEDVIRACGPRACIIHLHGAEGERDHLPPDRLAPGIQTVLRQFLERFEGSLSLEVFNVERLGQSMDWLLENAPSQSLIKEND